MASVATSNISRIDRTIANNLGTSLSIAQGLPIAVYRIASGQAPGDTAVLPKIPEMGAVVTALGACQHNLSGTGATQVTVTLTGNGTTATVGAVDVVVIGTPASS
ncbi:MAG: hypothetical protein L0Y58_22360 [Verrucomicrobia subdivision 3 bacterium]|nr:hypothetical protein [Limisphaerales bacterium]